MSLDLKRISKNYNRMNITESTTKVQNFTDIQLELDPNKILFTTNQDGIIVYEAFKNIKDYKTLYDISNFGRVKSLMFGKEKILRPALSNKYLAVTLFKNKNKKTRRIHQLVAESFLNHKPNGVKLVVNHINLSKTDNYIDNLEVITHRENTNRKHFKGTSKYTGVSWDKLSNKWRSQIQINGELKYLGNFKKEHNAHIAYNKALINKD